MNFDPRPPQRPLPDQGAPSTDDDHPAMVADCQKRAAKLTPREREFTASLASQIARGRKLSPKQAETLDGIWERVTT